MELTQKDLDSYKELYKRKFGIELSDTEAHDDALSMLHFMRLSIRPVERIVVERGPKYNVFASVTFDL